MMETDIQRLRKNAWDYMSSNSKRHIEFCAANNYIREEHNLQDAESLKASDIGMWAWEIVYHLILGVQLEFILVTFAHQYMT